MTKLFRSLRHILSKIRDRAVLVHQKIPILHSLPYASLEIIFVVAIANVLVWLIAGAVLRFYPHLSSSTILAYTLGLRHALDADHISAIDLTTRRLLATKRIDKHGQIKPVVTVGMWFSLGHSTIVIITTILVAATTAEISARFDTFSSIGGIIGSSVSTAFLLLLGAINAWLLSKGIQNLRRVIHEKRIPTQSLDVVQLEGSTQIEDNCQQDEDQIQSVLVATTRTESKVSVAVAIREASCEPASPDEEGLTLRNRSCLNTLLRWSLRLMDRPWEIYPLGILLGLGFDTSSEIALLGITTLESSRSNSSNSSLSSNAGALPASAVWAILIFPLLFTSGMCLLDTADGALMYALYTSRARGTSQLAIAYANVVLTGFTVLIALGVGVLQFFNMLSNILPQWRMDENLAFWDGVTAAGNHYDIVGGVICACFVIVALGGWAVYGRWKRKFVDSREAETQPETTRRST